MSFGEADISHFRSDPAFSPAKLNRFNPAIHWSEMKISKGETATVFGKEKKSEGDPESSSSVWPLR